VPVDRRGHSMKPFTAAAVRAAIKKRVTTHTWRHSLPPNASKRKPMHEVWMWTNVSPSLATLLPSSSLPSQLFHLLSLFFSNSPPFSSYPPPFRTRHPPPPLPLRSYALLFIALSMYYGHARMRYDRSSLRDRWHKSDPRCVMSHVGSAYAADYRRTSTPGP